MGAPTRMVPPEASPCRTGSHPWPSRRKAIGSPGVNALPVQVHSSTVSVPPSQRRTLKELVGSFLRRRNDVAVPRLDLEDPEPGVLLDAPAPRQVLVAGEQDLGVRERDRLERASGARGSASRSRGWWVTTMRRSSGGPSARTASARRRLRREPPGGLAARGVQPEHAHVAARPQGLEVVGDVVAVAPQRQQHAPEEVEQRDVVVARHDEVVRGQLVQPLAGAAELAGAGALRQVARDDDQVRLDVVQCLLQAVDQRRQVGAEVDVGDVGEDGQDDIRRRSGRRAAAAHRVLDEVDDRLRRRARGEHLGDPELLELRDVLVGDRAADDDEDVAGVLLVEQLDDLRHQRHVRAGEDRQADRVGVLLQGGLDDLLRRLVQAGVDDLHARVTQRAGDDLRPSVVAVQAGLRDDDADLAVLGHDAPDHTRAGRPAGVAAPVHFGPVDMARAGPRAEHAPRWLGTVSVHWTAPSCTWRPPTRTCMSPPARASCPTPRRRDDHARARARTGALPAAPPARASASGSRSRPAA